MGFDLFLVEIQPPPELDLDRMTADFGPAVAGCDVAPGVGSIAGGRVSSRSEESLDMSGETVTAGAAEEVSYDDIGHSASVREPARHGVTIDEPGLSEICLRPLEKALEGLMIGSVDVADPVVRFSARKKTPVDRPSAPGDPWKAAEARLHPSGSRSAPLGPGIGKHGWIHIVLIPVEINDRTGDQSAYNRGEFRLHVCQKKVEIGVLYASKVDQIGPDRLEKVAGVDTTGVGRGKYDRRSSLMRVADTVPGIVCRARQSQPGRNRRLKGVIRDHLRIF